MYNKSNVMRKSQCRDSRVIVNFRETEIKYTVCLSLSDVSCNLIYVTMPLGLRYEIINVNM